MHHYAYHDTKTKKLTTWPFCSESSTKQADFSASLQHLKQPKINHGSIGVEPSCINRGGEPCVHPDRSTDGNYSSRGKRPRSYG